MANPVVDSVCGGPVWKLFGFTVVEIAMTFLLSKIERFVSEPTWQTKTTSWQTWPHWAIQFADDLTGMPTWNSDNWQGLRTMCTSGVERTTVVNNQISTFITLAWHLEKRSLYANEGKAERTHLPILLCYARPAVSVCTKVSRLWSKTYRPTLTTHQRLAPEYSV